jgi:molecular chaperone GrpE
MGEDMGEDLKQPIPLADAADAEASNTRHAVTQEESSNGSESQDPTAGFDSSSVSETSSSAVESPEEKEEGATEELVPLAKVTALQKERDELYDKLLRKQAEFENFRKRTEKEKQEFYEFALAKFLVGLLPALDGLERAMSVSERETVQSFRKGIELILKQLRDHLSVAGVQPIRAMGQMFDPNLHQAVLREETASLPENEIIEEMQRGYTFKERLLRPSMVKVAVPPVSATEESAPDAVRDPEASD